MRLSPRRRGRRSHRRQRRACIVRRRAVPSRSLLATSFSPLRLLLLRPSWSDDSLPRRQTRRHRDRGSPPSIAPVRRRQIAPHVAASPSSVSSKLGVNLRPDRVIQHISTRTRTGTVSRAEGRQGAKAVGARSGERGTFDVSTKRSVVGFGKPPPTLQTCRSCCCITRLHPQRACPSEHARGKGRLREAARLRRFLSSLFLSPITRSPPLPCASIPSRNYQSDPGRPPSPSPSHRPARYVVIWSRLRPSAHRFRQLLATLRTSGGDRVQQEGTCALRGGRAALPSRSSTSPPFSLACRPIARRTRLVRTRSLAPRL